jgi:hypothetical protein
MNGSRWMTVDSLVPDLLFICLLFLIVYQEFL